MKHYENLMTAMTSFMSAMKEEHDKLIAESNAQAEEARSLIARVQNTIEMHKELTAVMSEISKQVDARKEVMVRVTDNVILAMADLNEGEIPNCKVDIFNGYCDLCGEELTEESEWDIAENGENLCPTCFANLLSEELDVDTVAE